MALPSAQPSSLFAPLFSSCPCFWANRIMTDLVHIYSGGCARQRQVRRRLRPCSRCRNAHGASHGQRRGHVPASAFRQVCGAGACSAVPCRVGWVGGACVHASSGMLKEFMVLVAKGGCLYCSLSLCALVSALFPLSCFLSGFALTSILPDPTGASRRRSWRL